MRIGIGAVAAGLLLSAMVLGFAPVDVRSGSSTNTATCGSAWFPDVDDVVAWSVPACGVEVGSKGTLATGLLLGAILCGLAASRPRVH